MNDQLADSPPEGLAGRRAKIIEIDGLRVTRGEKTICSVPALEVDCGERVTVLGANGSGKTTLMRVLAGLETDYQGRCAVDTPSRHRVYVHQAPYLFRGTVLFNVTYGLRARGMRQAERDRQALPWLRQLGLFDRRGDPVAHLSGGERRRVALARALVLRPQLLLLDEPLADLDKEGTVAISAALEQLEESTILVASPTTLPMHLTSRIYQFETSPAE